MCRSCTELVQSWETTSPQTWHEAGSSADGSTDGSTRCWERHSNLQPALSQPSNGLDGATLPLLAVLLVELDGESFQIFSEMTTDLHHHTEY